MSFYLPGFFFFFFSFQFDEFENVDLETLKWNSSNKEIKNAQS